VVKHIAKTHRPVLGTNRGWGVAVVRPVTNFETAEEEHTFQGAW